MMAPVEARSNLSQQPQVSNKLVRTADHCRRKLQEIAPSLKVAQGDCDNDCVYDVDLDSVHDHVNASGS